MYHIGRLVTKSYVPDDLEPGLLFYVGGKFIVLDHIPYDEDKFYEEHGFPVELYIIDEGNPNLNDGFVIAYPDEIGWFDAGDHTDDLEDITIDHLNQILQDDGYVQIELEEYSIDDDECQEDCEEYEPLLMDGKVVIRLLSDDSEEEEYEEREDFPDFHDHH
jgi:hypothetical protein